MTANSTLQGSSPGSQEAHSHPSKAERGLCCWHSWGRHWPPAEAVAATGSGQEGWAGLTFTLPAFPLVAWLAETFVGLGRVLADGINVAVICAL